MQNAIGDMLPLLACPQSHRPLRLENGELVAAERRYRVEAGVPICSARPAKRPRQQLSETRSVLAAAHISRTTTSKRKTPSGRDAKRES